MHVGVSLTLAASVALLIAPTAQASITPPGSQWKPGGAGCGFVSFLTNPEDPPNPHFEGAADCEVVFEPTAVPPTTTVGGASATLILQTCAHYDPQIPANASATCATNTVKWSCELPVAGTTIGCVVSYDSPPPEVTYFCVTYRWTEGSTTYTEQVEFDPATAGRQCGFVARAAVSGSRTLLSGVPAVLGCDDGLDNDGDGGVDSADPGCTGPTDPSEHGSAVCDDGADNDGDGAADYPADGGCTDPADNDESGGGACADGADNDGDGSSDYPGDPGCSSPTDTSEVGACQDGTDNDLDGAVDHPADPGCASAADPTERGSDACDDSSDNDGDGAADYPNDPGCSGPGDTSERGPTFACDDGADNDGDRLADYPNDPGCRSTADPNETTIP